MFSKRFGAGRRAKLGIERLEDKTLLAGDVSVVVRNGDLRITGDNEDNHVQVIATEDPGEYLVRGIDRGLGATRINGGDDEIIVRGVNDDITVNMRGGDNRIALLNGEFFIGGDLQELVVPDDLDIHNGSGRIEVLTDNVRVLDDLTIHTRNGFDDIALVETVVADDIDIRTRGGNDDVLLDAVLVNDDVSIKVGGGENFVSVQDSLIDDDLHITGGHAQGGDRIQIGGMLGTDVGDEIRVLAHAGNDSVCMLDVDARRMHVHMGRGNDRLDLDFVRVTDRTRLNGDGGIDTIAEGDNNLLSRLRVRTFEDTDLFDELCFEEVEPEPEPEPEEPEPTV